MKVKFSFLIMFAIVFYSCASKKNAQSNQQVTLGQMFSIQAKSNPTTGYTWVIDSVSYKGKANLIEHYYKSDCDTSLSILGCGGTDTWKFESTKKGELNIKLNYIRPWQKDLIIDSKTYLIKII